MRKKHPVDEARRVTLDLIGKIADRAVNLYAQNDIRVERLNVLMDVITTHFGGCKIRLADLLDADDFNFAHDIGGINRHLDRMTGRLTDGFTPRYSA